MSAKDTKKEQLGMSSSSASGRLVKDILFSLIKDKPCYHCGEPLTRETFSIEHKVPWLHSENPSELYFNLENIDFSHLICNIKSGRGNKKYNSKEEARLEENKKRREKRQSFSKEKRQEMRREIYLKYNK